MEFMKKLMQKTIIPAFTLLVIAASVFFHVRTGFTAGIIFIILHAAFASLFAFSRGVNELRKSFLLLSAAALFFRSGISPVYSAELTIIAGIIQMFLIEDAFSLLYFAIYAFAVSAATVITDFSAAMTLNLAMFWLIYILAYFLVNNVRQENSILKKKLKGIDSRRNIVEVSPFSINKEDILRNGKGGMRIASHIEDAVNAIVEIISRTLKVKTAVFFVYDRESEYLYPEFAISDEKLVLNRVENKGNLLYWCISNAKEIMDNLYVGNPENLGIYTKNTVIRSVIGVPVRVSENAAGILYCDSENENAFSDNELELMKLYADEISRLLNFAKYAEKSKIEATYFSALNDVVHELARTLEYDEVLNILRATLKNIMNFDLMFIAAVKDGKGIIEYSSEPSVMNEGEFSFEQSFFYLLRTGGQVIYKKDLHKRDIRLPIFNSKEKLQGIKSVAGAVLEDNTRYLIIASRENINFNSTLEMLLRFLSDITRTALEKAALYRKTKELAIKDGLTGLHNHRYFQEELDRFLKLAKRNDNTLALSIIDIDHFKRFNDTYGHQTGDIVLRHIADILNDSVRETDLTARYGGEEFVMIFNNAEPESVYSLADKIRLRVMESPIYVRELDKELSVTVSMGVALFPENAADKIMLIKKADDALYLSKENGRNRVTVAE